MTGDSAESMGSSSETYAAIGQHLLQHFSSRALFVLVSLHLCLSLKFFREGEIRNYNGARTTEGMVSFGTEMSLPAVSVLGSVQELQGLADKYPVSIVFFGGQGVERVSAHRPDSQPAQRHQPACIHACAPLHALHSTKLSNNPRRVVSDTPPRLIRPRDSSLLVLSSSSLCGLLTIK